MQNLAKKHTAHFGLSCQKTFTYWNLHWWKTVYEKVANSVKKVLLLLQSTIQSTIGVKRKVSKVYFLIGSMDIWIYTTEMFLYLTDEYILTAWETDLDVLFYVGQLLASVSQDSWASVSLDSLDGVLWILALPIEAWILP